MMVAPLTAFFCRTVMPLFSATKLTKLAADTCGGHDAVAEGHNGFAASGTRPHCWSLELEVIYRLRGRWAIVAAAYHFGQIVGGDGHAVDNFRAIGQ